MSNNACVHMFEQNYFDLPVLRNVLTSRLNIVPGELSFKLADIILKTARNYIKVRGQPNS